MEILNKAEHQRCYHYEDEAQPTVEIRHLEQGYEEEIIFRKNEIVFMTEGEVRFIFRDYPEKTHRKGEFVFLPMGGIFRYTVSKKTMIYVVRPNGRIKLCEGYRIEELYKFGGRLQENCCKEISALKINNPLWHFLDGLNKMVQGGLKCRYFFDTKVRELFILLNAYYPRQQLWEFFSLILSPDTVFSEYVRENYHQYHTVNELATSMNITAKHFGKLFTHTFGIPPGKWLKRERAQMIYHELRSGVKPLKQLSDEYGFSTPQQLDRFCKRELKKNPGEIRKGKMINK